MSTLLLYDFQKYPKPRCTDLHTARITVMGDNHCGKTSLIFRWLTNAFQQIEDGTYQEDIYHKTLNIETLLNDEYPLSTTNTINSITTDLDYDSISNEPHHTLTDDLLECTTETPPDKHDTLHHFLADIAKSRHVGKQESNYDTNNTEDTEKKKASNSRKNAYQTHKHFLNRPHNIKLQILDSQPLEIADFSELRSKQIQQSDAFILCFDSTNRESFHDIRTYQRKIERARGIDDNIPIILCCTKTDKINERKVSPDEIKDLVYKSGLDIRTDFFEVSSKHGTNVQSLLLTTLVKIENYKYQERNRLKSKKSKSKSNSNHSSRTQLHNPPDDHELVESKLLLNKNTGSTTTPIESTNGSSTNLLDEKKILNRLIKSY
ncbi:uncharacterized protein NDAI_0D01840 [Naumovozyma dairenensis CBS 421]|uniref:Uncharacterized protein n=1 Tax=Naumovozyma dairenensis (strain ATCC 10597 / BCRC 20456 / CBS 421 / NBRC 0211 / NRRL Y-12639) TaxID=1071378 RepID=G0W9N7_NAUDC|nr:hypothetical protein NDAI_0D01840 [Naumovozyma dairenensis CBS 421]CCD24498.1 hypothetical protein NDAI_0D01840 [Naumovozyma dairenensis CBS 421]